jgi:hypothetical protein
MLSLKKALDNLGFILEMFGVKSARRAAELLGMDPPISVKSLIRKFWIRLNFNMQHQQQDNWCWAATTVSVCIFFNPDCNWTQCSLVDAEFGRNDCCTNEGSNTQTCNKGQYLDNALSRTNNYRNMTWQSPSMNNVMQEIDEDSPLCARIEWSGGGAHAVAIYGYHFDLDMVAIADPWYGNSDVTLSAFNNGSYQGSGECTCFCRVKSEGD